MSLWLEVQHKTSLFRRNICYRRPLCGEHMRGAVHSATSHRGEREYITPPQAQLQIACEQAPSKVQKKNWASEAS